MNKAVTLILALLLLGSLGLAQNLATTCSKPGTVLGYSNEEIAQMKQSDPERYIQYQRAREAAEPPALGPAFYRRGPDADGYVYKDSDEPGGPTYSWDSFYQNQTTGDDAVFLYTWGWNFTYRGNTYTGAYLTTNGYFCFGGAGYNYYSCDTFPSSNNNCPYLMVGAYTYDLYADGTGTLDYGTTGTSPNRRVVITWNNVRYYSYPSVRMTFQLILNESDNSIVAQYATHSSSWQYTTTARSGCQNGNGSIGLNLPNSLLKNSYAVKYGKPSITNDVGVTVITAPAGLFCTCDTIRPVSCKVKNYGSNNLTGVPVTCHLRDSSNGALIWNQTVNVDVNAGATVDVNFPLGPGDVSPLGHNAMVYDTCFTSLAADTFLFNDAATSSVSVNAMADVALEYSDYESGSNGCYVWTSPNFTTAVRFDGPCPVGKYAVALSGYSSDPGGPYPCTCKIRENDGTDGMPGTEVYVAPMQLYSAGYPNDYTNFIVLDAPAVVTTDSFYVTWKPQVVANPFPTFDWDDPPYQVGNDFSTMPGSEDFNSFAIGPETDANGDLGIGAFYSGYLHDVGVGSIDVPPAVIDSNTAFTPVVTYKNAGLKSRPGSAVSFWITDTAGNKVSTGSGNTAAMNPGASESFTFPPEITLLPTDYMDSAVITCPAHDANRANDTMEQALFVRYYDVMCQIVRPMQYEVPGLVPITVRLTNKGNVPALVDSVHMTITDGYNSFVTGVPLTPGETKLVFMPVPWVCPAGVTVTANAWITIPPDMFHPSDSAMVKVVSGIPGWAEKTPMPATPTGKAIKDGGCMAYDAGTAMIFASKGNKTGDFYSYNAASTPPVWTNLNGIPLGAEGKQVYKGSVICSDGDSTLYLTKGNNTVGFWKYGVAANEWTQMTNVPLGSSNKKVKQGAGLAWATKAGAGAVYLLKGYRNEFHKYDPATNAWKQLLDAPIGAANHIKWDAGSWLVADADAGNRLYAFKGKYHEFYFYDTDADTWSHALKPMPIPGTAGNKKAKDGSAAAWYGGKIYAFKGGNTTEFWRYFPLGDTWNKQFDIPLIGMTGARKKVKAGGALAPFPGMGVFAFKGNKSLEFWNYVPFEVAGAQPSRDGITAGTTQIGSLSFAIAPNPLTGGLATVRYNLPRAGLATLNVFDVTGRTVLTQTLAAGRTGTAGLDLRKLEAGVYLVKVTTEGFSTTQKLVVEH